MDKRKVKFWIVAALVGIVVLTGFYFLWTRVIVGKQPVTAPEEGSVVMSVPSPETEDMQDSKSESYKQDHPRRSISADEYFGSLAASSDEDISLVSSDDQASKTETPPSTPSVQPGAAERLFGQAPPSQPASSQSSPRKSSSSSHQMTPDEKLEYDRKRAEMVVAVVGGGADSDSAPDDSASAETAAEPLDFSSLDTSDGIISSVDDWDDGGAVHYADEGKRPFRCMFVRDEKLKSGQRVTVRLLEEYRTEGGIRIPANTYLQAICKIGDRLQLSVRSLEMNGRIIPLQLEAYDTDGLQGIYCPDGSKAAQTIRNDAVSTAGTTFGGLVGDVANTIIRTGASIARSANGETSVAISSGYEFFLVKSEKR